MTWCRQAIKEGSSNRVTGPYEPPTDHQPQMKLLIICSIILAMGIAFLIAVVDMTTDVPPRMTNQEVYEAAKKCVDAGRIPEVNVWHTWVLCKPIEEAQYLTKP